MGGAVFEKGAHKIVRQVIVDRDKLRRIAEILEIEEAELEQVVSETEAIHIYVGEPPRRPSRRRR
jgi:hypothetical protein